MEKLYSQFQLIRLVAIAAELGAVHALVQAGYIKPYLKKSEAYRRFGRKEVDHWINTGLITQRKDGNYSSGWRISRLEIEAVANAIELMRHF